MVQIFSPEAIYVSRGFPRASSDACGGFALRFSGADVQYRVSFPPCNQGHCRYPHVHHRPKRVATVIPMTNLIPPRRRLLQLHKQQAPLPDFPKQTFKEKIA
ncbi:MAG: hypothetical protein ACOCUY_02425 [Verrucomicrobiota bacterium]